MYVYEGWEALASLMKTLLSFNDEFEKAIKFVITYPHFRGMGLR